MSSTILEDAVAGRARIVPWTVQQYHAAIEGGFLPEETGLELIEGFIVHDFTKGPPRSDCVLSVIEVADNSLARDLGAKLRMYAQAKIP